MRQSVFCAIIIMCAGIFSCSHTDDRASKARLLMDSALVLEAKDDVKALSLYEQALDILTHLHDTAMKREAHMRIGQIFLRNGLTEECLNELHQVYTIDSLAHDSLAMYYTLRNISFAYESIGAIDTARTILQKAVSHDSTASAYSFGLLQKDLRRYDDLSLFYLGMQGSFDRLAWYPSPNTNDLRHAYDGWIFEQYGKKKEAEDSYKKIITRSHSPNIQTFAILRLVNIYLQDYKVDSAMRYIDEYWNVLSKSQSKVEVSKELLKQHARHKDKLQQRTIGRLTYSISKTRILLIVLAFGTVVGVVVLLLWVRTYRQHQVILKFKIEKLQQLKEEYLTKKNQKELPTDYNVRNSDIWQSLMLRLNGRQENCRVDDQEWALLEQAVLKMSPQFRERLYSLCKLSVHDYHVCLLIKAGFRQADIARLTLRSDEAISSTRRRLYERSFEQKGSPAAWDEVITAL